MSNVRYPSVTGIGLDVHYQFSSVTMRDAKGNVVCRERLDHRDRALLRQRLSQWPRNVPVVMEASFGWAWLADLMKEVGLSPALSNCYKVDQMRKARGEAKTNRKDADALSLLPLEAKDWWKVWMAPPEVRDRREWTRYRTGLVELQTKTKNRIHALFHRYGIFHEFADLFGSQGRLFLGQLCQDGRLGEVVLPPGALAAMEGQVKLLKELRERLAYVAKELRGQLERTPLIRRLTGPPGIGLIVSHTIVAEVGVIERFRNDRALAAYSLLAPIPRDTGLPPEGQAAPLGRRLGQRGNHTLQWAFIEAAHGAVRSGGKWRRMYDAYTDGGRKNRNRGYIKVARELVKVVYVLWRKGVEYTDTPPARPGSTRQGRRLTQATRSGTGQPSPAMIPGRC